MKSPAKVSIHGHIWQTSKVRSAFKKFAYIEIFHEIVDFLTLTCDVAWKGKTTLLESQNVAPNAKSCSKVAEPNRLSGQAHQQNTPTQLAYIIGSIFIRA